MANSFFTVKGQTENTIIIEHSKFICYIKGVEAENDAKAFIETIRKKHSLANHNCYAYIADDKGLIQKFSDDGEPQGTAGLPMLEVLKNKKIYKTVAVVTRYFGGIKLGTGGLTRAYSGSVSECLNKCEVLDMQPSFFLETELDYEGYSRLLKVLTGDNVRVISTDFLNIVTVKFAVKEEFKSSIIKRLSDAFNGKIQINEYMVDYCAF